MYAKKRLELIIEKPAFRRACRLLEESGATGYTALPCMAGFGNGNRWQRGTDLSASRDMVMIISILDESLCSDLSNRLHNLIEPHIGLLSWSDVDVIRDEKF